MRPIFLSFLLFAGLLQVFSEPGLAQLPDPYVLQPTSRGSYLGLGLVDVDSARARALRMDYPRGTEVTRVEEGGPADKAGLRVGDVLLAYNGETVLGGLQLARLVSETPQDRRVTLLYWRAGKSVTTSVVTALRPRNAELPSDGWAISSLDGRGTISPAEIPFSLLVWRNMVVGIECEALQPALAAYFGVTRGVLVRSVQRGSIADNAGLRAGDVIVAVAEHAIGSPRELTAMLRSGWVPGRSIKVLALRDHKRLTADLTVPEDGQ